MYGDFVVLTSKQPGHHSCLAAGNHNAAGSNSHDEHLITRKAIPDNVIPGKELTLLEHILHKCIVARTPLLATLVHIQLYKHDSVMDTAP